jgi:hypothetical protein
MEEAEDLERFTVFVEADAVVAQAEVHLGRLDAGQALDVAVTGENVIGQAFEQTQGSLAVDASYVGARLWRPLDSFRHPDQPRRR